MADVQGPEQPASERPPEDAAGQSNTVAEEPQEVGCAAEAVRCAEAELRKARELYEKLRHQAADRLKAAREASLGDVIDGTLSMVKKYPGPGVLLAGVVGFFLGRLFRR